MIGWGTVAVSNVVVGVEGPSSCDISSIEM